MRPWTVHLRVLLALSLAAQAFPAWATVAKVSVNVVPASPGAGAALPPAPAGMTPTVFSPGLGALNAATPAAGIVGAGIVLGSPGSGMLDLSGGVLPDAMLSPSFGPSAMDERGIGITSIDDARAGRQARAVRTAVGLAAALMMMFVHSPATLGRSGPQAPPARRAADARAPATFPEALSRITAINAEADRLLKGHPREGARLRRYLDPMNETAARARGARDRVEALTLAWDAVSLGRGGLALLKRGAEKDASARKRIEETEKDLAAVDDFWARRPGPWGRGSAGGARARLANAREALAKDHADEALREIDAARKKLESARFLMSEYQGFYPGIQASIRETERIEDRMTRWVAKHPRSAAFGEYASGQIAQSLASARAAAAKGDFEVAANRAKKARDRAQALFEDSAIYEARHDKVVDLLSEAERKSQEADRLIRDHPAARAAGAYRRVAYATHRTAAQMKLNVGNAGRALREAEWARAAAEQRLRNAQDAVGRRDQILRDLDEAERGIVAFRVRLLKLVNGPDRWFPEKDRSEVMNLINLSLSEPQALLRRARFDLRSGSISKSSDEIRRALEQIRSSLKGLAFLSRNSEELALLLRKSDKEYEKLYPNGTRESGPLPSLHNDFILHNNNASGLGSILDGIEIGRFDERRAAATVLEMRKKWEQYENDRKVWARLYRGGEIIILGMFGFLIAYFSRNYLVQAWNDLMDRIRPWRRLARIDLRQQEVAAKAKKWQGLFGLPSLATALRPSTPNDLNRFWNARGAFRAFVRLREAFALQNFVLRILALMPQLRKGQQLLEDIGVHSFGGELKALSDQADALARDLAVRSIGRDLVRLRKSWEAFLRNMLSIFQNEPKLKDAARYPALRRTVGGIYEIKAHLGEGGLADVYLGIASDGKSAAIKIPKSDPDPNERQETIKRLQEEAQLIAGLHHDGIPRPLGQWVADGVPYYAMEFVRGETLERLIQRRGGKLEPSEAARIMSGVLEVLDYFHREGICYRDLKPSNIMIRPDGRISLVDFGSAHRIAPGADDVVFFTPGYIPRTYIGDDQSPDYHRSDESFDVFTAGRTLRAMLTGDPESKGAVSASLELNHVVETAEQEDRSRRYADAGKMLAALRSAREHLSATATRPLASLP